MALPVVRLLPGEACPTKTNIQKLMGLDNSKFIFLYLFQYKNEAIHVVAKNVLVPRGLLGIGRDKLDHSGAEIAEALTLYTSTQTTPVLVHCTQGKDRTGK